ncbi:MAG: DUF1501 domain-containing protein [Chloroflexota bacterium]|jgi:uncharacterized protein (DUF1501 family)|nr:DUF1501 domain-containing protein [Chloroflexota bacterium]MDP6757844.1 DUF1501 domain-containing protein [Chloroflexota bacterium]
MKILRRQVLKWGAALVAMGPTVPGFVNRTAYAASARNDATLVLIQLIGGNDGLATVVPYSDPAYADLRPEIADPLDSLVTLTDEHALHPAMAPLRGLWDEAALAIVQGVGYPNPNRSHFRSIEIWDTAQPDRIDDAGWLGRYLDHVNPGSALYAINVGDTAAAVTRRTRQPVPSVPDLDTFSFNVPDVPLDAAAQLAAIERIYAEAGTVTPQEEFLRGVAATAMQAASDLRTMGAGFESAAEYPSGAFGDSLRLVAQLIAGGSGTRVFTTTLGGFDTHSGQQPQHTRLLETLAVGIVALMNDLRDHRVAEDVVIATYSEFGRRPRQNGSDGTDHGTAAPLFVIGESVRGGMYGATPSLTDLDAEGDLRFTTDFRSVYATLLDRWLDAPSGLVLEDSFPALDFLD